jgi:hypothetical protein
LGGEEKMTEQRQAQFSKELVVNFINRSGQLEEKKFEFSTAEEPRVKAGLLKQRFLACFEESPVELENESITDENRSYHLTGFDGKSKKSTSFQDEENVDLSSYTKFEISPRTTGGGISCFYYTHCVWRGEIK